MTSCQSGRYKSVRIDSGLNYGACHDCILFPRPSIGLLGGLMFKDSIPWGADGGFRKFDAVCWRTVDGGRNWSVQKITDGSFGELVMKDDIVYATIITHNFDEEGIKTEIHESRDLGESWKYKCAIKGSIIRLHVIDSKRMIGDTGSTLSETRDGGKSWDLLKTKYAVGKTFYRDDHVYYFSYARKVGFHDLLVRRNLYTGAEKKMTLPEGFTGVNGKENIMFCRRNEELRVYRINDNFTLTYLSSINRGKVANVQYIGIYNEHIFIFVNFITTWYPFNQSFYYSSDGGRRWTQQGAKGLYSGTDGSITDYTDSSGFNVVFYRDIYSLGTFTIPAENK